MDRPGRYDQDGRRLEGERAAIRAHFAGP
jgi:hypothetical protein